MNDNIYQNFVKLYPGSKLCSLTSSVNWITLRNNNDSTGIIVIGVNLVMSGLSQLAGASK